MQSAQNLIIGVDAGATKTHCRLSLDGRLLSESTAMGANLTNQPIAECVQIVTETIKNTVNKVNNQTSLSTPFNKIVTVVGIAGLNTSANKTKLSTYLRQFDHPHRSFLGTSSYWYNDAVIGFAANSNQTQGLVIIAGTGSSVLYLSPTKIFKSGNWGYILGDDFSGFTLGQRLLKNLMATLDGRKKSSLFYRHLALALKVSSPYHLVSWLEKGDSVISRTASVIELIEKNQLSTRQEFVTQAAHTAIACAHSVKAVITSASLTKSEALDIVLTGGLFKIKPIALPIKQHLQEALPQANVISGPHNPVEGAIKLGTESLTSAPRFIHHAIEI